MKIAVTCDHLIDRMDMTSYVEELLMLYPKAEIFTYCHRAGRILGDIEHHKIHSTYLTHKVKTLKDFRDLSYLIPTTQKNFAVPCSFDLIFNISTGLSQGIRKCKKTKMITYLMQWPFEFDQLTLKQKIFKSYINGFAKKGLDQADEIWVSRDSLFEKCKNLYPTKNVRKINPFFNVDDYPLIPSSHWTYDVVVISTEGINSENALDLFKTLNTNGYKVLFVGQDAHLEEAKKVINDEKVFYGQRCSGDLAPLMASCLVSIDLSQSYFPNLAVRTLSAGRPTMVLQGSDYKGLLKDEGVYWLQSKDPHTVLGVLESLKSNTWEPKNLRRNILKFHPSAFKTKVKNHIQDLVN